MKTPEDINRLREIATRLKELGLPERTIKHLDTWIDEEESKVMVKILQLANGKNIYIQGKEITTVEAHEIIIKLTETWGTDFEKQELKDMALGIKR